MQISLQVQQSFVAFQKRYAKPFELLKLHRSVLDRLTGLDQRLAKTARFTNALFTEGLLVVAATHKDEVVQRSAAEEQIKKLASEVVDRSLIQPALLKKAESLLK